MDLIELPSDRDEGLPDLLFAATAEIFGDSGPTLLVDNQQACHEEAESSAASQPSQQKIAAAKFVSGGDGAVLQESVSDEYVVDSDYEYENPFATEEEVRQSDALNRDLEEKPAMSSSSSQSPQGKGRPKGKKRRQPRAQSAYTLFVKDFVRNHWDEAAKNKTTAAVTAADKATTAKVGKELRLIDRAALAWRECDSETKTRFERQASFLKAAEEQNCAPAASVTENGGDLSEGQKKGRPLTAYMLFVQQNRDKMGKASGLHMSERSKKLPNAWKSMNAEEKRPYIEAAAKRKKAVALEQDDQQAAATESTTSVTSFGRKSRQRPKVSYRVLNAGPPIE